MKIESNKLPTFEEFIYEDKDIELDKDLQLISVQHPYRFEFEIKYKDEIIGNLQLTRELEGIEGIEGDFIPISTVEINDEFKGKGLYGRILSLLADKVNLLYKEADGIASFKYDTESGDFERTESAERAWNKLLKINKKAKKHGNAYYIKN